MIAPPAAFFLAAGSKNITKAEAVQLSLADVGRDRLDVAPVALHVHAPDGAADQARAPAPCGVKMARGHSAALAITFIARRRLAGVRRVPTARSRFFFFLACVLSRPPQRAPAPSGAGMKMGRQFS